VPRLALHRHRSCLGHLRPHSFSQDQFRSEWINTTRKS
jgi:hypothetical protein